MSQGVLVALTRATDRPSWDGGAVVYERRRDVLAQVHDRPPVNLGAKIVAGATRDLGRRCTGSGLLCAR